MQFLNLVGESKQKINANVEILQMIVKKFHTEDFSKRLLNDVFFNMESNSLYNVDFNIALISKDILPLAEWDKQISMLIRDAPGNLMEKVVHFLSQFIQTCIVNKQI